MIRRNAPASWDAGASESSRRRKGLLTACGDLCGFTSLSLVMVSLNPVEKKPVFRQHRLNSRPLPHGHGSLRPSFSLEFLVPVDDPAAPLDVGFAQGSLDAAWTWFSKGDLVFVEVGSHGPPPLAWSGSGSSTETGVEPDPSPWETSYVRLRFGVSGHDPSPDQCSSRRYAHALPWAHHGTSP